MVRIITVEREYGSRGGEFAHLLAEYLGWRIIDNCIVDEIARKLGLEKAAVANCDERLDPWYYRLGKTFWHASVERMPAIMSSSEVFDSERHTSLVRDYLKDRVAEGQLRRGRARGGFGAGQCPGHLPCLCVCLNSAQAGVVSRPVSRSRGRRAAGTGSDRPPPRQLYPPLLQPGLERPPALSAHAELVHGGSGDDRRHDGSRRTVAQRRRNSRDSTSKAKFPQKDKGRT